MKSPSDNADRAVVALVRLLDPPRALSALDVAAGLELVQVPGVQEAGTLIVAWFVDLVCAEWRAAIVPRFWQQVTRDSLPVAVAALRGSLDYLPSVTTLLAALSAGDKVDVLVARVLQAELFRDAAMVTLMTSLVANICHDTLSAIARLHCASDLEGSMDDNAPSGGANDEAAVSVFAAMHHDLHALGLLACASHHALEAMLRKNVEVRVKAVCAGVLDRPWLPTLLRWREDVLHRLLAMAIPDTVPGREDQLAAWQRQTAYLIHKTLCQLRIDELFDIIIDFPESAPALEDLRQCLAATDSHSVLVATLKASFQRRLLQPGADTAAIITTYISAIKALRVLDAAGLTLELVCRPIRAYLRGRADAVRCIVTRLIDDTESELYAELTEGKPLMVGPGDDDVEGRDDHHAASELDADWTPDPVSTDAAFFSRAHRTADITSLLVNIYGSPELFVEEYRTLLADRLLALNSFNADKEIRNVELLKLRFGEARMHLCDVMLKDMTESRRIMTLVSESLSGSSPCALQIFVLSRLFWPAFKGEALALPPALKAILDDYTIKYAKVKAARTLDFMPTLGLVRLDLQIREQTLDVSVAPMVAAIIVLFEDRDSWTLDELSLKLQVPTAIVARRIEYWTTRRLLQKRGDAYVLDEDAFCLAHGDGAAAVIGGTRALASADADDDGGGGDTDDGDNSVCLLDLLTRRRTPTRTLQDEEDVAASWPFVHGMLQALGALPLSRIFENLQLFSSEDLTEESLKRFLEGQVTDGLLLSTGGAYQLPPS